MARSLFVNRNFKYPLSAQGVGTGNNRDFWRNTFNDWQALADLIDPNPTLVNGVVTANGAGNVPVQSVAGSLVLGMASLATFTFPDAATTSYDFTVLAKIEVLYCVALKDVAGAGNTIQVLSTANAITNAMAFAVDNTITVPSTIDPAFAVIPAGGILRITNTRAAGSSAGQLSVWLARRA